MVREKSRPSAYNNGNEQSEAYVEDSIYSSLLESLNCEDIPSSYEDTSAMDTSNYSLENYDSTSINDNYIHRLTPAKSNKGADPETGLYICVVCEDAFLTLDDWKTHRTLLHKNEEGKVCCKTCNTQYTEMSSLKHHYRMKHSEVISNNLTATQIKRSKASNTTPNLTPNEVFACHCGKTFSSSGSYARHKRLFHGRSNVRNKCFCGKTFSTPGNLSRHKRVSGHTSPKATQKALMQTVTMDAVTDFACTTCAEGFDSQEQLLSHENSHKTSFESNGVTCNLCNKKFRKKSDLRQHHTKSHSVHSHSESYSGDGNIAQDYIQCDLCEKSFKRISDMRQHLSKSHNGAYSVYSSDEYKSNYLKNSDIDFNSENKHPLEEFNSVKSEYPSNGIVEDNVFSCTLCTKSFKRMPDLRQHMTKSHGNTQTASTPTSIDKIADFMNQGSFLCDVCDKSFHKLGDLRQHVTKCHNKIPIERDENDRLSPGPMQSDSSNFSCDDCGRVFTSSFSLKQHWNRSHYRNQARSLTCAVCHNHFPTDDELHKHLVTHASAVQYNDLE